MLSNTPESIQEKHNLIRTLEFINWGIAAFIGVIIIAFSPFIAHNWFNPESLERTTVQQAVCLMAIVIAAQWPSNLYMSALAGLQRQVLQNILTAVLSTVRGVG